MDFYRMAEYRIALGENSSKVLVGQLLDETKLQFTANNYILAKDIKEFALMIFLNLRKMNLESLLLMMQQRLLILSTVFLLLTRQLNNLTYKEKCDIIEV